MSGCIPITTIKFNFFSTKKTLKNSQKQQNNIEKRKIFIKICVSYDIILFNTTCSWILVSLEYYTVRSASLHLTRHTRDVSALRAAAILVVDAARICNIFTSSPSGLHKRSASRRIMLKCVKTSVAAKSASKTKAKIALEPWKRRKITKNIN